MPVENPPNVQTNDIIEFTIKGQLCGQTVLTVLHYRVDSVANAALPDVMDELHDAFAVADGLRDKYKAAAASNYHMDECVLQVIDTTRLARFSYTEDEVGGMANEANTADLAAVIKKSTWFITKRSLKADRGMTGSVHFAPVPSDKILNGIVDAAYRENQLDILGAKVIDNLEGDFGTVCVPVLYHKDGTAPKWTDVNRYHVMPEARVMRRRTVGRGI